jgi:exodeoxyribonuclease VII large subunit
VSESLLDGERYIYTIGELLSGIRHLLEDRVGRVWVVGEVSDLFRAASGHVYFTLKDEEGQIRAAFFRSAARRAAFELEDGLEVLVYGDATVYQARGDLQLVVRTVEPRGQGALQLAFEQLRRRLEAEGLFDPADKRPLPSFPRRIGVVTSAAGAALRDVIEVSRGRFPTTPILVAPTRVQGEGAESEIASALDLLAGQEAVDVILLVRGGGSLEDLWCFNTEVVARAVARCPVPVVSGVGHEVDFTIADWVADLRAPTPSAAAALALPDRGALRAQLDRDWARLAAAGRTLLERGRSLLARERDALRVLAPSARVAARRARLLAAARALVRSAASLHGDRRARVGALVGRLDSLSPLAVLARGYALVRTLEGAIVRRAEDVAPGQGLAIQVAEADLEATVERVRGRRRGPAPSSA